MVQSNFGRLEIPMPVQPYGISPDPVAAILAQQHARANDPVTDALFSNGRVKPEPASIWGPGGRRMSMDEVTANRARARSMMAAGGDYSPVSSWTQGLARVTEGLLGGMEMRQADKDAAAYAEQRKQDIASILLDQQDRASAVPSTIPDASASLPSIVDGIYQPGQPSLDPVAEALMPKMAPVQSNGVNPAIISAHSSDDPVVNALAGKMLDRHYAQNTPQYFMSGKDRVMFNPATGESQTVYDAQQDFQEYADSLGLEPGSPEYNDAMQDFVLRANGPTAIQGRVDLENTRQGNRETMEGIRQTNRIDLRSRPTYANLHPRPAGGGSGSGGGGRGNGPPRNTSAVYAPILAKLASGQTLTPAEQQTLSYYRGARGGRTSSVPTAPTPSLPPTGSAPTARDANGRLKRWNGKVWVDVTK